MNSEAIYNIKYIQYIEGYKIYKNMLVKTSKINELISNIDTKKYKIINIIKR